MEAAKDKASKLSIIIEKQHKKVSVVGPAPAFYERRGNKYRWQILVKSARRESLANIARELYGKKAWTAELDPVSLL